MLYQYKMTQYNNLNVKLSNSQLNKLKQAKKWNWSSFKTIIKIIGNSHDETKFPHQLLLTNRPVANLFEAFVNYLSADIKFYWKLNYLKELLGRLLGPLLKIGLRLTKNILNH